MNCEKKSLFVISPIGEKGSEIRKHADNLFENVIEKISEKYDYLPERADKIAKLGHITTTIVQKILDSDVVIADLSYHNPNVFYELAIRHAIKKHVILVKREEDYIPFDIAPLNVISYCELNSFENVDLLQQQIGKLLETIEKSPVPDNPISAAIDLQALSKSKDPFKSYSAHVGSDISDIKNRLEESRVNLIQLVDHLIVKKNHYGIEAEYINGEEEAFRELTEATLRAKKEVRSSRFFPHSVLAQQDYVNAIKQRVLGADGKRRLDKYYRIVAINNKSKQRDIISHLNNFVECNFKLYLTQDENNFELVIIDDTDAFIHFYKEEKVIASTLHIKDKDVVREFKDIFDKLRTSKNILKEYDCSGINNDNLTDTLQEVNQIFTRIYSVSKEKKKI